MTAIQARKLIGKKVQWEYAHDNYRGTFLLKKGVVQEVKYKNINIDGDWYWLPHLINLKEILC